MLNRLVNTFLVDYCVALSLRLNNSYLCFSNITT
jgi:hypothetical protein